MGSRRAGSDWFLVSFTIVIWFPQDSSHLSKSQIGFLSFLLLVVGRALRIWRKQEAYHLPPRRGPCLKQVSKTYNAYDATRRAHLDVRCWLTSLHLDARCEQMQGTGLHLASRCEKMQAPEQFQSTDALKKSSKAPPNCIFGCTRSYLCDFRHLWCFTRHIWFRSRSIMRVLSPFLTTFPTCPGKDANNAGI